MFDNNGKPSHHIIAPHLRVRVRDQKNQRVIIEVLASQVYSLNSMVRSLRQDSLNIWRVITYALGRKLVADQRWVCCNTTLLCSISRTFTERLSIKAAKGPPSLFVLLISRKRLIESIGALLG